MLTVIGQLATHAGLVQQYDPIGNPDPYDMPANTYLRDQPLLPLLLEHDRTWPVGDVQYLQRSRVDGLLMVATAHDDIADLLRDYEWRLSAGVHCHRTGTMQFGLGKLHEMSLVKRAANLGTKPVYWSPHDAGQPSGLPLRWRSCWDDAQEAMSRRRYRRHDALRIVDLDELDLYDEVMTDPVAARAKVRAALPTTKPAPPPTPTGPTVNWYGTLLTGEVAKKVIDAIEDGVLDLA